MPQFFWSSAASEELAMKIDPRIQSSNELQSDSVANAKKNAVRAPEGKSESSSSSVVSGDTFQVSSTQATLQQLSAQITNVPDVRAERVAPLKAAVAQNGYSPDSGQIADAMLADQSGIKA
jgi:flagellar biosynthesis anti-sigma factor FlgM